MGPLLEWIGRTCSICHKRITKLSDLELDQIKPYSKGGTKLALAQRLQQNEGKSKPQRCSEENGIQDD